MGYELTRQSIQRLLRAHGEEILRQLGPEEVRLGVSLGDPEPCIHASVRPERVIDMPKSVVVTTEDGAIEIPLKATGDYESVELH